MPAEKNSGVIHAIMSGRLGNQFFKYAFARALQIKYYPDYHINVNFYHLRDTDKSQGFGNSLKDFRMNDDITYTYEDTKKLRTPLQFMLTAIRLGLVKTLPLKIIRPIDTKLLQPLFNKAGLYNPVGDVLYITPRSSHCKNIYCAAHFEAHGYSDDIRDILLEEFTPKYDVLPHNKTLLDDINNSESVCVTIRRGDFLSEINAPKHNVCGAEYFSEAMNAIHEEIPGCKFFVFSDDVEDVKRTMHFPSDVVYESGNDPVWEKIRLMYSCKHFIISNSTFSWWAQYLSRNPNKIVYAPSPWRWTGENCSGIYTPNMRLIQCRKPQ